MRKCLPCLLVLAVMPSLIPCTLAQDKPDSDQDVSNRILKIACRKEEEKPLKCDILLSSILDLEELKQPQ